MKIFIDFHNKWLILEPIEVEIRYVNNDKYEIRLNNKWLPISGEILEDDNRNYIRYNFDGVVGNCDFACLDDSVHIFNKVSLDCILWWGSFL